MFQQRPPLALPVIINVTAYGSRISARVARLSGTTKTIQSQTPVRRVGKAQACPPFLFCTRWWARRDAPLPTLQITSHTFAFSLRAAPEVCISLSPRQEGAGNAGCALHPRSRVQRVERKAHTSIQGSGGNPTFPAQWLYGLCRAHPGDEFVLSPSPAD